MVSVLLVLGSAATYKIGCKYNDLTDTSEFIKYVFPSIIEFQRINAGIIRAKRIRPELKFIL